MGTGLSITTCPLQLSFQKRVLKVLTLTILVMKKTVWSPFSLMKQLESQTFVVETQEAILLEKIYL